MATKKITDLSVLSASDAAALDVLPIVDIDANETKKIHLSSLKSGSFSGSFQGDGSGLTGISSITTGSLMTTASVSLNTITFTKGDGTTFPITVDTGSGGGGGGTTIDTGSLQNTIITGSLTVSGSGTFTNIGPAVFKSGSFSWDQSTPTSSDDTFTLRGYAYSSGSGGEEAGTFISQSFNLLRVTSSLSSENGIHWMPNLNINGPINYSPDSGDSTLIVNFGTGSYGLGSNPTTYFRGTNYIRGHASISGSEGSISISSLIPPKVNQGTVGSNSYRYNTGYINNLSSTTITATGNISSDGVISASDYLHGSRLAVHSGIIKGLENGNMYLYLASGGDSYISSSDGGGFVIGGGSTNNKFEVVGTSLFSSHITASGNISASGASTASFGTYYGDGSNLTGISAGSSIDTGSLQNTIITGSLTVSGSTVTTGSSVIMFDNLGTNMANFADYEFSINGNYTDGEDEAVNIQVIKASCYNVNRGLLELGNSTSITDLKINQSGFLILHTDGHGSNFSGSLVPQDDNTWRLGATKSAGVANTKAFSTGSINFITGSRIDLTGPLTADTITGVTGSFTYLQGNSPLTVTSPTTFQQSITSSVSSVIPILPSVTHSAAIDGRSYYLDPAIYSTNTTIIYAPVSEGTERIHLPHPHSCSVGYNLTLYIGSAGENSITEISSSQSPIVNSLQGLIIGGINAQGGTGPGSNISFNSKKGIRVGCDFNETSVMKFTVYQQYTGGTPAITNNKWKVVGNMNDWSGSVTWS